MTTPWSATDERGMRAPLSVALLASVSIVISAPFVGEIRGAIQAAFPGQYRSIVLTIVAGAVAVAAAAAVARIRERRALRYGLLALALGIGVAYARATSSGNPDVDAVERFHFVEYGLLALLYHRVWRDRRDLSAFALPMLAGLLVAIGDELLQWFIPFRVGEMRDVLLNGVALGCGLLFGAGLTPPRRLELLRDRGARATLARVAVVTIIACAIFFHAVHLGHDVRVQPVSRFLSRFSAEELVAAARDRPARWDGEPPSEGRFSREDHYLAEARWHIQERNEAVSAGDIRAAWHEQLILDAFFEPVLEVLPGVRWPPEQRAEAEARAAAEPGAYRSAAHPHPIYPWNPRVVWTAVAAAVVLITWVGLVRGRPSRPAAGRTV